MTEWPIPQSAAVAPQRPWRSCSKSRDSLGRWRRRICEDGGAAHHAAKVAHERRQKPIAFEHDRLSCPMQLAVVNSETPPRRRNAPEFVREGPPACGGTERGAHGGCAGGRECSRLRRHPPRDWRIAVSTRSLRRRNASALLCAGSGARVGVGGRGSRARVARNCVCKAFASRRVNTRP